jgi:hypothetical protein
MLKPLRIEMKKGLGTMNANTRAIVVASLECYARQLERDAKEASGFKILLKQASEARYLKSLLEHGSTLP